MASAMTRSKPQFNIRRTYADGASATTDIAISGIATEDVILWVDHISTKADNATVVDISSEVSITSAGNIQLSSTDTSSDLLRVVWMDVSA